MVRNAIRDVRPETTGEVFVHFVALIAAMDGDPSDGGISVRKGATNNVYQDPPTIGRRQSVSLARAITLTNAGGRVFAGGGAVTPRGLD